MSDRLFVPLKTEHFRNFESGEKTWELRGVNNQFNEETVVPGRTVELRRGYSTDDSIWGEVAEVRTYESISAVADDLPHQRILPGATREEFQQSAAALLSGYDQYIAFQVD